MLFFNISKLFFTVDTKALINSKISHILNFLVAPDR